MKDRFMKNGVFSLEYDKETLKDMVLELQEELECTIGIVEHNRIISKKNKEIHQLKEKVKKLEILIESLKLGVTLNQEQEDLLDEILFRKIEGSDE